MSEYKFDSEAEFKRKQAEYEREHGIRGCGGEWTGPGWYSLRSEAWDQESSHLWFVPIAKEIAGLKALIESNQNRLAELEALK